jgi:hypothetical protein
MISSGIFFPGTNWFVKTLLLDLINLLTISGRKAPSIDSSMQNDLKRMIVSLNTSFL